MSETVTHDAHADNDNQKQIEDALNDLIEMYSEGDDEQKRFFQLLHKKTKFFDTQDIDVLMERFEKAEERWRQKKQMDAEKAKKETKPVQHMPPKQITQAPRRVSFEPPKQTSKAIVPVQSQIIQTTQATRALSLTAIAGSLALVPIQLFFKLIFSIFSHFTRLN
jgi:lysyl-tRNA synthetase class I